MAYDFEKDASAKSFEMKLDNDTIMTAFITTDEDADGTLPELSDGVYGGIGYGPMSQDFEFLGSGGGGGDKDSDLSTVEVTINNTTGSPQMLAIAYAAESEELSGCAGVYMAPEGTSKINAVLYKNVAMLIGISSAYELEAGSGSAEMLGYNVKITGECSINVTAQSN